MSPTASVLLALAVVLGQALPAAADRPGREDLIAPPQEIFEAMLLYAEQGEFQKVDQSVRYLGPLLDDLAGHYPVPLGADIRRAAAKQDRWETQAAILRLIYYDMKHELATVAAPNESHRSQMFSLRIAYLDFLLLRPSSRAPRRENLRTVERSFKEIHEMVAVRERGSGPEVSVRIAEKIAVIDEQCRDLWEHRGGL